MLVAGAVDVSTLDLEVHDETTQAHLTVIDPDGNAASPVPTGHEAGARWTAEITYDRAGIWTLLWSTTGTGAGAAQPQKISVAPGHIPPGRRYATTTQLANYLRDAVPDDADVLLERATERVDEFLLTAVYQVDADGMPVDATVKAALAKATCAQVDWMLETGDDGTGAISAVSSASIGGVSIGYGTGPGAGVAQGKAQKVRAALAEAQLLTNAAWTY